MDVALTKPCYMCSADVTMGVFYFLGLILLLLRAGMDLSLKTRLAIPVFLLRRQNTMPKNSENRRTKMPNMLNPARLSPKPITFSAEEVLLILDGQKTQFRLPLKPNPYSCHLEMKANG